MPFSLKNGAISLLLCWSFVQADGPRWQLLPAVGHTTETGWMVGMLPIWYPQSDHSAERSHLEFAAYGTTHGQFKIESKPKLSLQKGNSEFLSETAFLYWPSDYYGIGAAAAAVPQQYNAKLFSSENTLLFRPFASSPHFWWGPRLTIRQSSLQWKELEVPAVEGATGTGEQGVGIQINGDWRDHRNAATHGMLLSAQADLFPEWIGNKHPYSKLLFDCRGYTELLWRWSLAVSFLAEQQFGTPPLLALSTPDGKAHLRGFQKGRYRDRSMAVVSGEIRVPLFWRIGGTFFAEAGRVGETLLEISKASDGWVQTVGLGGRLLLHPQQRLNARGDLSLVTSADGQFWAITIQVGEAF